MSIGIVILTKGKVPYLTQCLQSIIDKTEKTPYTVYIGDTGSTEAELQQISQFLVSNFPNKNVKLIQFERYNFASNNNTIISKYVNESLVLLCNNDIKLIDNCIDKLVEIHQKEENVGTVGCRLLFDNGTVQHAGQAMWTNDRNMLEITHRGLGTTENFGDLDRVVGNTGGFMLVSKKLFIDSVSAYHYESMTRTRDEDMIKRLKLDYTMNLFPYFRSLTKEQQQVLLEI